MSSNMFLGKQVFSETVVEKIQNFLGNFNIYKLIKISLQRHCKWVSEWVALLLVCRQEGLGLVYGAI